MRCLRENVTTPSYEPDNEKENASSVNGGLNDNASVGTGAASSNGGGSIEEGISSGTWSVRFSSSRTQSVFLTRGSIRALRRALLSSIGNTNGGHDDAKSGKEEDNVANISGAVLPLFLERRQRHLDSNAGAGKSGKGAKRGKKAGKRATAEQSQMRPEMPWLCRANVDLSPLVLASTLDPDGVGGCGNERKESPAGVAGSVRTSDSPLRVELRAALALETVANEKVKMEVSKSTPKTGEINKQTLLLGALLLD